MEKTALQQLEGIFFPVKKVEATDFIKTVSFASNMTHLIICDIPNKGKWAVNACSKDYGLVPNKTLFTPIVQKLQEAYNVEVKSVMRFYSKFYIDFIIKDLQIKGATKSDIMFPRLRINNSYDGSVKFSYVLGFYRLICGNGATAPVPGTERSSKWMHTPQIDDGRAAEEVMRVLGKFMEKAKSIAQGYNPLIDHKLSFEQALERIQEIHEEVDYPKSLLEKATARLSLEHRELKQPINDYLVYNAMNYALYQTPDKEQPEHKRDKMDAKVLDFLIAENN